MCVSLIPIKNVLSLLYINARLNRVCIASIFICVFFFVFFFVVLFFFFQAEDGIRYLVRSRGLGDVYKRQDYMYEGGRPGYKNLRKVKWITKGQWEETSTPIVVKTLTDITKYPDYVSKLKALLNIKAVSYTHLTLPTSDLV